MCSTQRVEVGGCMDNHHDQEADGSNVSGGYLLFNLGVLDRAGDSVVVQCSPSQSWVWQHPNTKTT